MSDHWKRVDMARKDREEPGWESATHPYDLTRSRVGRRVIPVRLVPLVCAAMAFGGLACTSEDTPTEPAAAFLGAASASHALTPVDLGLVEPYSLATALNNRGQVVGERAPAFEAPGRAFLWTRGSVTDLGTLGGLFARAFGINERSQIVGDATTAGGQTHAFLWEDRTMRDLGTLGGDWSSALDINNRGHVIGNSMTSLNAVHGFFWEDGVMTDIGTLGGLATYPFALNNRGQVVGSSLMTFEPFPGQPVVHAFLWRDGTMTDLGTLGGFSSEARGINDRGQVVGYADTPTSNGEPHGFLWQDGKMTDLGSDFVPRSINNRGQILGSDQAGQVLIWERGEFQRLPGFATANDINDRGMVAGDTGSAVLRAVVWTK